MGNLSLRGSVNGHLLTGSNTKAMPTKELEITVTNLKGKMATLLL